MISIPRLLGLLLLFLFFEVAIWVLGTALLPDTNILLVCAVMTGIAVGVWLVYIVVMRWTMRPRIPVAPFPSPAGPPPRVPQPSADPETTALKQMIREAEQALGSSSAFASAKQKPQLLDFPIYITAGSDSPGKTTVLLNSGLEPRLLAGESYRDGAIAPTRLCNFYFASGRIFVEAGSRLFDDPDRWTRFLSTLFSREKKPFLTRLWQTETAALDFRGLLLCCGLNGFTRAADPARVAALSQRIQSRIESLARFSSGEFPVYVIFTRTDALPYFEDFVSRLNDEEDREIVGCTLPVPGAGAFGPGSAEAQKEEQRKSIVRYYSRLYASLSNKRLTLLAREVAARRKPSIYEFPRELKRIRPKIASFLADTFRPNPLQLSGRLRGFYFCGVRKMAGAMMREVLSDATVSHAVPGATVFFKASDLTNASVHTVMRPSTTLPERGVERWVFLSKLFRDVIIADNALLTPAKPDTRMEMYRLTVFGTAAAICLLLTIGFVTSLVNNRRLIRNVEGTLRSAAAAPVDPSNPTPGALRGMDELREVIGQLSTNHREGAPWGLRWGLYTGNALLPQVRSAYFAQFRRVFLAPVLNTLATRFSSLNANSRPEPYDSVYDALKAYRTITSGACSADPPTLGRVLPEVWLANHAVDSQSEMLARRQFEYYAAELAHEDPYGKRIPENASARKQAQDYLLSFKGPEQIYRGLIAAVNQNAKFPARLASYAPEYAQVLTGPSEVPASFTRQGFAMVEQRIRDKNFSSAGESCVVGSGSGLTNYWKAPQSDLQTLYFKDYIRVWRDFLARQQIAGYRSLDDAVRKLGILSGNRSPMLGVLAMAAENTTNLNAPASKADEFRADVNDMVKNGVTRYFPKPKKNRLPSAPVAQPPPQISSADIAAVFQPVRTLVNPGTHDRLIDEPNRAYINSLAELKNALDVLPRNGGARLDVAMNNQARQALDKAYGTVREAAQRFNIGTAQGTDADLTHFLQMPLDFAGNYVPKDPHKPLVDKVNGQLRAVCGRLELLRRRFPFNPQADTELTDRDLAALFAPGIGAIWSFQRLPAPLTGLLLRQGELWVQNPAVPEPRLTPDFLDFFNRLAGISAALFPADSAHARLQYTVQALPAEGVQAVHVDIGGVPVSSTSQPAVVSWPPPPSAESVDLQVTMNGISIPFGRYEGQWAIFRLMQDGEPQGNDTYLFRSLRQGHGKPQQVTNAAGDPVAVRLLIRFPAAFDLRAFHAACPAAAAQ